MQTLVHRRASSSVVCNVNRRDLCTGLITLVVGTPTCGAQAAVQQLLQQQQQQLTAPYAISALQATAVSAAVAPGPLAQSNTSTPRSRSDSSSSCNARLDPALAAAFIAAVYDTVRQQQVMPEQQLQVERHKLQTQEYKYYAAYNKDRMPALPYLEDNSGGLSNSTYYNFVSYVLWKVVARHLPTAQQRTNFCAAVGETLLQQLVPATLATVRQAAAGYTATHQAPASVLVPAIQQLLNLLQQGGFVCGSQLVWGSQPGSWPADWGASEPDTVGLRELQDEPGALPSGSVFQVKLSYPADIEGSVALRSEEGGFWSRQVSSMLAALLHAGGYHSASVDEYFYQDYWQGPSRAADKLLLLFGDPLQQVDVPWTPTTLVQNWTI